MGNVFLSIKNDDLEEKPMIKNYKIIIFCKSTKSEIEYPKNIDEK